MVGKAGFGAVQRTVDGFQSKCIIGHAFFVFHRDVGHCMLQLRLHLQKQPPCLRRPRPDIGMGEGIQDRAVHMNHEHPKKLLRLGFVHGIDKRFQKFIQLSHVNRIICDTWHMFIKNQKTVQRLIQIRGSRKLKKFTAFLHKFLIIRRDVAGAHRRMAFGKIADAFGINARI